MLRSHRSLFVCAALALATCTGIAAQTRNARADDPAAAAAQPAHPAINSPLDFTVKNIDGKSVPLSAYKGKVVMIVNTASKCGFTPQYASLQKLYEKYKDQGFVILAFPANNYGHQEPGTDSEIKEFCSSKYATSFDLFSKVSTMGDDQAPIYKYLTDPATDPKFAGQIKWNFTKFLIDRDGKIVARFEPKIDPLLPAVTDKLEATLSTKPATAVASR